MEIIFSFLVDREILIRRVRFFFGRSKNKRKKKYLYTYSLVPRMLIIDIFQTVFIGHFPRCLTFDNKIRYQFRKQYYPSYHKHMIYPAL